CAVEVRVTRLPVGAELGADADALDELARHLAARLVDQGHEKALHEGQVDVLDQLDHLRGARCILSRSDPGQEGEGSQEESGGRPERDRRSHFASTFMACSSPASVVGYMRFFISSLRIWIDWR